MPTGVTDKKQTSLPAVSKEVETYHRRPLERSITIDAWEEFPATIAKSYNALLRLSSMNQRDMGCTPSEYRKVPRRPAMRFEELGNNSRILGNSRRAFSPSAP